MRNPGGYLIGHCEDGRIAECDTFTCAHCQRVTFVKPKQKPEDVGGLCKICMGLICPQCTGQGCVPFERTLEAQEARGRMLRDMGLE